MIWLTILSILRSLFAAIDRLIAWGIEEVYIMIVQLANIQIFSGTVIETFASRINVLLGLFMLFWLSLRIIKYVIDPDLTTDKQQGFGKIITNVMIMLAMLLFSNFGFKAMYSLQNMIFESDILPNLIFGTTNNEYSGKTEESTRATGKKIGYYIYAGFAYPSVGIDSPMNNACKDFFSGDSNAVSQCIDAFNGAAGGTSLGGDLRNARDAKDPQKLLAGDLMTARKGDQFLMNYTFIISSICGGAALVVLVQIAINVAIRIAKLGLLQLIAPIPIISYIDPKSGKDGIFHNWLVEVGKTFASVFVQLISLYFSVFLVMMIVSSKSYMGADVAGITAGENISFDTYPLLTVMMIIGSLLFAKEMPKLISQIFGVKLDGGSMGFAKKALGFGKAAAIGTGAALGAGAIAGGGAMLANTRNLPNKFRNAKDTFKDKDASFFKKAKSVGSAIGSIPAGAVSGSARGMYHNVTTKDGVLKSGAYGRQASNDARNNRDAYQKAGYGMFNRVGDAVKDFSGVKNSDGGVGKFASNVKDYEQRIANYEEQEHQWRRAQTDIMSNSTINPTEFENINFDYKAAMERYDEQLANGKISEETYKYKVEHYAEEKSSHYTGTEAEDVRKYLNAQRQIDNYDSQARKERGELKKAQAVVDSRNQNK